jgi:hypothetical protein
MPGDISGLDAVPVTPSPISGSPFWPRIAIITVERHAMSVKVTTHGFRLCVASEIAPKTGIETTTSADAIPFTVA